MLLTINHTSRYDYDQPVNFALQRLRLWPQNIAGQVVREWSVEVSGADREVSYVDGFGNKVELFKHERSADSIIVRAHGVVETEDRAGVVGKSAGGPPLWIYERVTDLTKAGPHIRELAEGIRDEQADQLALLHTLMNTIHSRVVYSPGTTSVATEAEVALDNGAGVCQDHSHIFLSAARLLGIPSRYVSGYLRMEGVTDQTASHAWAEAYVDSLGWVGFDAANNICPNHNYVRIAVGLDYRSAAPVSGVRMGAAVETLDVHISVEQ
ncbi:transglutaminase family protein [Devosia sp. WQ 349]|uniref:transglutaminase family protein n=1 Tax=Devosia sp. WQ 349K1 TaxID=2800329 RepID=UPI001905954C|nr:transglutaminase family protein [Devosia sp. WQ 349K1]